MNCRPAHVDVVVPIDVIKFLGLEYAELRLSKRDVYLTEGVYDWQGWGYIPPQCLGVIRYRDTDQPVFEEDRMSGRISQWTHKGSPLKS